MLRRGYLLALSLLILTAFPASAQQGGDETVPPVTAPIPISQMLRNAGYNLSADEGTFLDADERLTDQFVTPVLTVELQAPFANDEFSRQVILAELRKVVALDPGAAAPAPASLSEVARISVLRRTAIRQAAQGWLAGLEANDPSWVVRGSDAYGTARQAEVDWYAALRQRLGGTP
jgi:hypothetical protein